MKGFKKMFVFLLSCLVLLTAVPFTVSAAAADYVTVTRSVNPSTITTLQESEVSLNLQGTPPVNVIVPNDVILIIDKSGSMLPSYNNGEDKIGNAKAAAKGFIDLMDLTKHRVGIVDFSSDSMIGSFDLSSDAAAVKHYIDGISANGSTATGHAIDKARELLENHRPEAQPVIVILTDGDATVSGDPSLDAFGYAKQKAQIAKDEGIIFYTIALLKATDNPDTSGPNLLLKEMATTSSHHHFVLGSTGLAEIYAAIVKEIGIASAYDVTVTDTVAPQFEIVPGSYDDNIPKPEVQGNTLVWKFNELKNNSLTFKYKVRPVDRTKAGTFNVSASSGITYKDYAGAARTKTVPNSAIKVTLPAPVITAVTDASGPTAGGNTVVVTGQHFISGAKVTLGNTVLSYTFVSDTELRFVAPAYPNVGTQVLKVTNPDSQFATGQYAYRENPLVTSYSPNNGPIAGGTLVIFQGSFMMNGIQVLFGDKPATTYMHASQNTLKVYTPAVDKGGPVDITLNNPDGTTLTIEQGYQYNEPVVPKLSITSVTPNSGKTTGGETVYVEGTLFDQGVKVYFGEKEATVTTFYNSSRVKVTAPSSAVDGSVDVKVTNPNGDSATLEKAYTYIAVTPPVTLPPVITNVSPASGLVTGGDTIYIEGSGFVDQLKVYFGDTEGTLVTFYGSGRIKAKVPAAQTPGKVTVKIVNPDAKEGSKAEGYEYLPLPAPPPLSIKTISVASGPMAGGTVFYIEGVSFKEGISVYFGSIKGTVTTYYSSGRIKVTSPASPAAGAVDVKLVNPDGEEAVKENGFEFLAPPPKPVSIKNVTPNSGLVAGGNIVTIEGVNFAAGLTVLFDTTSATINDLVNSTRVKVVAPPSATVGTVSITITNLDGQTFTLDQAYTYDAVVPKVSLMTPTHGPMAGGTTMYIDGSNFDSSMTITFNGVNVPIQTYYGTTRIKLVTPSSSSSGDVPVVITLPNGNSVEATYTYDAPPPVPAPVLKVLNTTSGKAAGGYTTYIDGSGFQSGMVVYFESASGAKAEATIVTFYNATRIKIKVPAGAVGPVSVYSINPDGQQSNTLTFTYT